MTGRLIRTCVPCLICVLLVQSALAAEWQWSVSVDSVTSWETNDHPRAFLWIPSNCRRVRAVVLGQHNMIEEPLLEHPAFREALAELGFAAVWVTPGIDLGFNADTGVGAHFEALLSALAIESGYEELATVPVVPVGHSASSGFPWAFAVWKPERTLAALSVSGSFPWFKRPSAPTPDIAGLVTLGDYEGAANRLLDGSKLRAARPQLLLSAIGEMGGGHFDTSDRKVAYIALYLKKAAQYRLGADGRLRHIDPTREGWLVDRWRQNDQPKAPPGPVGGYVGDPGEAFWFFDEELARATESFQAYQRGLKAQLLGYVQDGKVVEQNPKLHEQVRLRFLPLEDGISFKLSAAYLDTVPPGRPEWWTGLKAGSPIAHGDGPITITRICGPVVQTGPDTWQVRFDRLGMNNRKRSNSIWLFASNPGDDEYKRSVQQAQMIIPLPNKAGREQRITFPPIADQPVGARSLKLHAASDAGLPVRYYVREGPAEIKGDTLEFTALPPRARLPVRVTVVAWQYGRSIEPKVRTAESVERSFNIGTGPAVDLSPVWEKATQAIRAVEAAEAEKAARAAREAEAAPNAVSFNICKALGMRPSDLAGAEARVGHWNNIRDLGRDSTVVLDNVLDKSGRLVPGMTVAVIGGATPQGSFDYSSDEKASENDARLFNGLFDADQGRPTVIKVKNIPYARYDVYFYRDDDGDQRAGKFTIGKAERIARGGQGKPEKDGTGYAEGSNYVKFENLSGADLEASFTAVGAGDRVMRNKVVGFQIVERK